MKVGKPVDENPYKYSLTTRFKDRYILEMLGVRAGDRVLDVGCGLGYFMEYFGRIDSQAVGLDYDFESLVSSQERSAGFHVRGEAITLPFRANVFDKVLFTDVIEHLENDRQALAEIARVSAEGAVVVVTTVGLEGLLAGSWGNRLFHDDPGSPEYHVRDGYTAEELGSLLQTCGVRAREVRYTTGPLAELFIELLKLLFSLKRKSFGSQADALQESDSLVFWTYRTLVFPVLLWIGRLEEQLLGRWLRGHVLIVKGEVVKQTNSA